MTTEIQTRNEKGEIQFFNSFKEAFEHSQKDDSVWKISFSLPNGERIRLVKDGPDFILENIDTNYIMCQDKGRK
jgi:hypothetical protein